MVSSPSLSFTTGSGESLTPTENQPENQFLPSPPPQFAFLFPPTIRERLLRVTDPIDFGAISISYLVTSRPVKIEDVLPGTPLFYEAFSLFQQNSWVKPNLPDGESDQMVKFIIDVWNGVISGIHGVGAQYSPPTVTMATPLKAPNPPPKKALYSDVTRPKSGPTPMVAPTPRPQPSTRPTTTPAERSSQAMASGNCTLYVHGLPEILLEDPKRAMQTLGFTGSTTEGISTHRTSKNGNLFLVFTTPQAADVMYQEKARRLSKYPKIRMEWARTTPSPRKVEETMASLVERFQQATPRGGALRDDGVMTSAATTTATDTRKEEGRKLPYVGDDGGAAIPPAHATATASRQTAPRDGALKDDGATTSNTTTAMDTTWEEEGRKRPYVGDDDDAAMPSIHATTTSEASPIRPPMARARTGGSPNHHDAITTEERHETQTTPGGAGETKESEGNGRR